MNVKTNEVIGNGLPLVSVALTVAAGAAVASFGAPILAFAGAAGAGAFMTIVAVVVKLKQARQAEKESGTDESAPGRIKLSG